MTAVMQCISHKGCFKHSVALLINVVSPSFCLNSNRFSANQVHRALIDINQYMFTTKKKKKKGVKKHRVLSIPFLKCFSVC